MKFENCAPRSNAKNIRPGDVSPAARQAEVNPVIAFTCCKGASTALANGAGFGLALVAEVKLRSTFHTRWRDGSEEDWLRSQPEDFAGPYQRLR